MTHDEQLKVVSDLIETVKTRILREHEKWPKEWEGVELKTLISCAFEWEVGLPELKLRYGAKRIRDIRQEIIVKNLA